MLRRMKHAFIRLSTEEKVTLIGGLAILFGSFMPWYQVNLSVTADTVSVNGFGGDMGVIGLAVFLLTLFACLLLVGEHMRFRMPTFGHVKEKVMLFLTAQSVFLLLLTLLVYTKRSLDFTNAEIRFGLYTALIGGFFAAIAAYATLQRLKRREVQDFFGRDDNAEETEDETEDTAVETDDSRDEIDETMEEEIAEEAEQMSLSDFSETEEADEPAAAESDPDQARYFVREAGLRRKVRAVEEKEAELEEAVEEALEEAVEEVAEEALEEEVAEAAEEALEEELTEETPSTETAEDDDAPPTRSRTTKSFYED